MARHVVNDLERRARLTRRLELTMVTLLTIVILLKGVLLLQQGARLEKVSHTIQQNQGQLICILRIIPANRTDQNVNACILGGKR